MENKKFGQQLRIFRLQTLDPKTKTGKPLSQKRLGEMLGMEMGDYGFSGTAISDWENGKSLIHKDDRLVLIAILKILYKHGGIKTVSEAESLLEVGNYRALDENEKQQIFPKELLNTPTQPLINLLKEDPPSSETPLVEPSLTKEQSTNPAVLWSNAFSNILEEFQQMLNKAKDGPPPVWPRVAVAVANKITGQWTIFHVIRFFAWLWIWLIAYLIITPSLQWPFASQEHAFQSMRFYAAGTVILPVFITAMIGIKNNPFWQDRKTPTVLTIRLYIYQGASIGFHLGYFVIFAFSLMQYYFQAQPAVWVEAAKMLIPLFIGYASAHLIPYNLWRAYGGLYLKDGGIFFIFIILGPFWAWFFLEFYETLIAQKLGVILILLSATLLAGAMAIQYRRKGTTTIPLLWMILFYGLIFICQIASLFIQ